MRKCPVCEKKYNYPLPAFCDKCAWDFELDIMITPSLHEIPTQMKIGYAQKLAIARRVWHGYLNDEAHFEKTAERESLLNRTKGSNDYQVVDRLLIKDLDIGSRVIDYSWLWEFRPGANYSGHGDKRPITWVIVAKNHYGSGSGITLMSDELIGFFPFDSVKDIKMEGQSRWGHRGNDENSSSGLSAWLNSTDIYANQGFYKAIPDNFKRNILETSIPNREWDSGKLYFTKDSVFIPSLTEVGLKHHLAYSFGDRFPYFTYFEGQLSHNKESFHWVRSPSSTNSSSVHCVKAIDLYNRYAYSLISHSFPVDRSCGVCPAVNITDKVCVTAHKSQKGFYEVIY